MFDVGTELYFYAQFFVSVCGVQINVDSKFLVFNVQ